MTRVTDILKDLRRIEPDPEATRRSRIAILATPPKQPNWFESWNFSRVLIRSTEPMAAMVLAGLLLAVLVGGLPLGKFLAPLKMASLDPGSLRAEAQAIDIQIQLTDLNYPESVSAIAAQSTAATSVAPITPSPAPRPIMAARPTAPKTNPQTGTPTTTTPATPTAVVISPSGVSIDSALDFLTSE